MPPLKSLQTLIGSERLTTSAGVDLPGMSVGPGSVVRRRIWDKSRAGITNVSGVLMAGSGKISLGGGNIRTGLERRRQQRR